MSIGTVTIEDARIVFRNFAGKEGQYNREGDRNFAVVLDRDIAQVMAKDGWNVKQFKSRDEDEGEPDFYIQVSVNYKGRPPRVALIGSNGRTELDEESIEVMDWVDIAKVDLILNPYEWSVSGKSGVKAYLKSMFVTINEDELEKKYSSIPEAGASDEDL